MSEVLLPDSVASAVASGPRAVHEAVIESGGAPLRIGNMSTLLHLGVADGVDVRHWLDIFPPIPPFARLGAGIWATTFELPPTARIEYKININRLARNRLKLDTLNPLVAAHPWGHNSELRGADYRPPEWVEPDEAVPAGEFGHFMIRSHAFDSDRHFHFYLPQGGTAEAVLVVHDGDDYRRFAALGTVLDNLIARGEIPPLAAVLIDPVDRMREYRASSAHASFVVDEVLPVAREIAGVEPAIAMGASLGGVASLHAAWSHPGSFAGLVLQAPSLVTGLGPFGRGPVFKPVMSFMHRFLAEPGELPARIHVSCGTFDGLINETRQAAEKFAGLGAEIGYSDVPAGHDWHAWRDQLRAALMHVTDREED